MSQLPAEDQGPPKFRHSFRFSLATLLGVILLSSLAGYLACVSVQLNEGSKRIQAIQRSYFESQQSLGWIQNRINEARFEAKEKQQSAAEIEATSDKIYSTGVEIWYGNINGSSVVSRDAVDQIMRRAASIEPPAQKEDLPRILDAKLEGDQLLAYRLPGANGSEYAFLLRENLAVFMAEKLPKDARWVERDLTTGTGLNFITNDDTMAFLVPGLMIGIVFWSGLLLSVIAFFRWRSALRRYRKALQESSKTANSLAGMSNASA